VLRGVSGGQTEQTDFGIIPSMVATLEIDGDLLTTAEQTASEQGQTLSAFVERGLYESRVLKQASEERLPVCPRLVKIPEMEKGSSCRRFAVKVCGRESI
jgi:hypothetical protein